MRAQLIWVNVLKGSGARSSINLAACFGYKSYILIKKKKAVAREVNLESLKINENQRIEQRF